MTGSQRIYFVCHVEAQKAQDACPELAQRVQTQSKISVEMSGPRESDSM